MGLLVGQHLDAVLQAPQLFVGQGQFAQHSLRDMAAIMQSLQGYQGPRTAQFGSATTEDQLLGLDIELNLADTASAQFEVYTFGGQSIVDLVNMYLSLDSVDVSDGGKVEITPPDKGLQLLQKPGGGGNVSCTGPRLDVGGPFPILTDALIIFERRRHGHGGRCRARIGSQPQIYPKHIALAGAISHQLYQ